MIERRARHVQPGEVTGLQPLARRAAASSTHMAAASNALGRRLAMPRTGLQARYVGLHACHASRPGYQGSGLPAAARQALACSVSMASRRACAAASHPVKRKATGSGERSTASKASHAPGSPASQNHGSAHERYTACRQQPDGRSRRPEAGLDTASKASQATQESQARREGRLGRATQSLPPSTRSSAEERRQLVAIVVGEGCAAPRRVFGGRLGAAGCLDTRIRGSVGLHHCCVAACGACVWRGRPSGRKARAACWRGGVVKRDPISVRLK